MNKALDEEAAEIVGKFYKLKNKARGRGRPRNDDPTNEMRAKAAALVLRYAIKRQPMPPIFAKIAVRLMGNFKFADISNERPLGRTAEIAAEFEATMWNETGKRPKGFAIADAANVTEGYVSQLHRNPKYKTRVADLRHEGKVNAWAADVATGLEDDAEAEREGRIAKLEAEGTPHARAEAEYLKSQKSD